jgi:hypothetical protein
MPPALGPLAVCFGFQHAETVQISHEPEVMIESVYGHWLVLKP